MSKRLRCCSIIRQQCNCHYAMRSRRGVGSVVSEALAPPARSLDCRAAGAAIIGAATNLEQFRIRSYWTQIVLSNIIESAHFFVRWREARSMLILEYELMRANGSNL